MNRIKSIDLLFFLILLFSIQTEAQIVKKREGRMNRAIVQAICSKSISENVIKVGDKLDSLGYFDDIGGCILDTNQHYNLHFDTIDAPCQELDTSYFVIKYFGFGTVLEDKVWYDPINNKKHDFVVVSSFKDYKRIMYSGIIGVPKGRGEIVFFSGYTWTKNVFDCILNSDSSKSSMINYIEFVFYNYNPVIKSISDSEIYFASERNGRLYKVVFDFVEKKAIIIDVENRN